ncbi:hypothetical protein TUSST3_31610 [Streptomyces sp. TUS-ST3]|nr:hypothetical protein TUSST3_31610 [Streptomyces sp. TUS-ST3]
MDAVPAEAQSAGTASSAILHTPATFREPLSEELGMTPVTLSSHSPSAHPLARYRRILARAPHTCMEHQRPRPAGLRS